MLDQVGAQDEAAALIDWVVDRSVEAADWLTEAWARLVRATMAMRVDDWAAARDECRLARVAIDRLEYKWWQGAALRLEATIVANDTAFAGLERGWSASMDAWRQAIDTAAAEGSLGGLALTLRAAASVAARLGHEPTAQALLEAVPDCTELSVLPLAFPEELARLEADAGRRARRRATSPPRCGAPMPPSTSRATVRRRRDAGDDALRRCCDATATRGRRSTRGRRAVVRHLKGLTDIVQLLAASRCRAPLRAADGRRRRRRRPRARARREGTAVLPGAHQGAAAGHRRRRGRRQPRARGRAPRSSSTPSCRS